MDARVDSVMATIAHSCTAAGPGGAAERYLGTPIVGALHAAVEQAVAVAVREIEGQVPIVYVAHIGEYAYSLVPAERLDELPAGTPLVARIQGTATARAERIHTTVGERLAEIDSILRVVMGPRPEGARPGGRRRAPLPQPRTPDEAHELAEQFGGA